MKITGKRINFLGDSITQGCGTSSFEKCFTNLIAEREGAICRNYGIGGTRIARQIVPSAEEQYDKDFCGRVEEMDSDADVIVVFGGTNDFGHGDAPLGEMSDRTPDTFYGGLHTLYRSLIEKYPEAYIVVLTPLHRCNEHSITGDNKPEPVGTLKTYVDIIRQVAEYYSLPVLDLYAVSGLQPNVGIIKYNYMPDGLHPNDAGHEILYKKIAGFLKAL